MAMLFMSEWSNGSAWADLMRNELPDVDFRAWPEVGDPDDIEMVLAWRFPLDRLREFPNLKAIASLGAGVDHVVADKHLIPEGVTLTRLVDPSMTTQMTEWVVLAVLARNRRWDEYRQLQAERRYEEIPVKPPGAVTVGVMGLGVLGGDAAQRLRDLGFDVRGWSRSPKTLENIACFAGRDSLAEFLAPCDFVVCLLPLTAETRNILDADAFAAMKQGAWVINAARGDHIVDADLIAAIDSGHIAGATLDVQRKEPMPDDHPFWYHERIVTFPHIAAVTIPESCAPQIAENYRRMKRGEPLANVVDLGRDY